MNNAITILKNQTLPALFAPSPQAGQRYIEFFTANIRNSNTRRAYLRAASDFAAWCESVRVGPKDSVFPIRNVCV